MENFGTDVRVLYNILTNLVNHASEEEVLETKFSTSYGDNEFLICFVPPNTHHPLRHVVGNSPSSFLLVSRCFEGNGDPLNESPCHLRRYKNERVLVGTPLSQEVHYLTSSQHLQAYPSVSKGNGVSKGCVSEWFLCRDDLRPSSLESARYFLSLYTNALRNLSELLSVWVYVDSNNLQGISYLAVVPENGATSKPQNSQTASTRSMRHVVFSNSKEPIVRKEDLPELSSFLREHVSCNSSSALVETHGYALYEVMGQPQAEGHEGASSRIVVELTWNGVDTLLQPRPHSCDGVLHIKSVPGSVQLGAHPLYLELTKIGQFCKIMEGKDASWPTVAAVDTSPVAQQMEAFFAKVNSNNVFSPTVGELEEDGEANFTESSMAHLTFQEFVRKDLDFTERLWFALKDCTDAADLANCLQIATSALFNGKCQPVVHSSNMTSLAVFIRDLLQFETKDKQEQLQIGGLPFKAKPFLDPKLAIKCLVEIGSEKLARDYTQFFIHEELATMGQLTSFLNNNILLSDRVSNIKKLHQTLELVVTAQSVTRLGHENLRSLAQSSLAYYQSHSDSELPTFSVSLPAFGSTLGAAVKNICSASNPAVWCVAIRSKTKTTSHTTIVQLSTHHPTHLGSFQGPARNLSELKEEELDPTKDKFEYFLSSARQVAMPIICQ